MTRTPPLIISPNQSPLPLPLLSAFSLLALIALLSALCASHRRKSPASASSSSEGHEEKTTVVLPATHGPIGPTDPPGIPPRRKLSFSLSLKLSRVRTSGRREAQEKEGTAEDSTWMKAIILGEKCRVPDQSGEQEIKNYHPRTPRSMPVSRTSSFVDVPFS